MPALPPKLRRDMAALAAQEAKYLWGYEERGAWVEPRQAEYKRANRQLIVLVKVAWRQHGEEALDEALDVIVTAQEPYRKAAMTHYEGRLPDPRRPKWASATRAAAARVADRFLERVAVLPREDYLPAELKGKPPTVDPEGTDVAIWTWTNEKGEPVGVAFQGKSNKPLWMYRFRSESNRRRQVDETIERRKEVLEEVAKRKEMGEEHGLNVGDILVSSWGYDQTNIDFYEVTRVMARMVEIRKIEKKIVGHGRASDDVMPVPGRFKGRPMKKRPGVASWGGKRVPYVNIASYASAYLWDGKPKSQTAAGYGH